MLDVLAEAVSPLGTRRRGAAAQIGEYRGKERPAVERQRRRPDEAALATRLRPLHHPQRARESLVRLHPRRRVAQSGRRGGD